MKPFYCRFNLQKTLPPQLQSIFQRPLFRILLQIAIIAMVWCAAVIIKKVLNLSASSGVLGLFLMLALLLTHIIKFEWVNVGAKFILSELVLLFIPLMMSITQYKQLFFEKGWQLLVTIIVSTALVMMSTAITFMLGNRIKRAFYRRQHLH